MSVSSIPQKVQGFDPYNLASSALDWTASRVANSNAFIGAESSFTNVLPTTRAPLLRGNSLLLAGGFLEISCNVESTDRALAIIGLEPSEDEIAVSPPITDKPRGVSFAETGAGTLVGGWSVVADDPMAQGSYGVYIDGLDSFPFQEKMESPDIIVRETQVAALDDDTSVILVRRVSDPDQPGQLVFQRFSEEGNKLGLEVEVTQTKGVGAKIVPLSEGFVVLYLSDTDGRLKMKGYDFAGELSLAERDLDLTLPPDAMAIARGEDGLWVLAARQGENIEVRSFMDTEPNAIDARVGSAAITADAKISVGMAPDGSVVAIWNALENNTPFLQGLFLSPDGERYNDTFDIEELIRPQNSEGNNFINSHAVTTDERGNFILAFEQGGNLQALSFRDALSWNNPQRFTNLTPNPSPVASQGNFMDFLMGLTGLQTTRDEVSAIATPGGNLYLGYTTFFTGQDSFGDRETVSAVTYRPFEIVYAD